MKKQQLALSVLPIRQKIHRKNHKTTPEIKALIEFTLPVMIAKRKKKFILKNNWKETEFFFFSKLNYPVMWLDSTWSKVELILPGEEWNGERRKTC